MLILDINNIERTVANYMAKAAREGEVVWFDVDGTIIKADDNGPIEGIKSERTGKIDRYSITPLGEFLISGNVPINILTFRGLSKEQLIKIGFNVLDYYTSGTGMAMGLIDVEGWDESKKVKYLVDNEIHVLSPNQIWVCFE